MQQNINKIQRTIVFKYGGNAMTDEKLKQEVLQAIGLLSDQGLRVVIVHGGGPFIKQALETAGIQSEFVDGQRKTTPEALQLVEMTLKGKVNSNLVSLINKQGYRAVGLSGKDGKTVTAEKRQHVRNVNGKSQSIDLGRVGNVSRVDTALIQNLLKSSFIPVIACIADDAQGEGYNINGDLFAGHIAGALQADQYIVLTDVNGLQKDKDDPATLISRLTSSQVSDLKNEGVIQGGMIPKVDSCITALNLGVQEARIINGTEPGQISMAVANQEVGTIITKS